LMTLHEDFFQGFWRHQTGGEAREKRAFHSALGKRGYQANRMISRCSFLRFAWERIAEAPLPVKEPQEAEPPKGIRCRSQGTRIIYVRFCTSSPTDWKSGAIQTKSSYEFRTWFV
jgi:hypothetical protein